MKMTVDEWADRYRQAWESADDEGVVDLFTPEAHYRSNIFEEPHQGSEGIAAYWRAITASQSDVRVRMGSPFVDGRRAAIEFWTTMRVDGAEITLPGCLLVRFTADGRCEDLREYWQTSEGLVEPPAGWGN